MARGILWIVLTVCALLFVGCSNHPPSAAQFMNARNGINFVVGGAARAGNLDNRKIPRRDDESVSYEEGYWNTDLALSSAGSYVLFAMDFEDFTYRTIMGGRSRYFGVQGWYGLVFDERGSGNLRHVGGVMLVEQYPVLENFKVGISEHVSRNSYRVIDDPGCCSINTLYPEIYPEFGAGAYVVYKGFSAEFRYGREIGASNNRFYFQLNYAFLLKEWNYSK